MQEFSSLFYHLDRMNYLGTYLDQRSHVCKMRVHSSTVWEVTVHSLHEIHETAVGYRLWEKKRNTFTVAETTKDNSLINKEDMRSVYNPPFFFGRSAWVQQLTIVKDDKQRGHEITHPLNVTNIQGLPHVTASKNITESNAKITNTSHDTSFTWLGRWLLLRHSKRQSLGPRTDQCQWLSNHAPTPSLTRH